MITVGSHGLTCPEGTDYGAIALYMQDQAQVIDGALDGISDDLDTFFTQPVILATSTATYGPNSSFAEQIFCIAGTWAITYDNSPLLVTPTTCGFQFTVPRSGVYKFGGYVNAISSGAVTNFSRRTLYSRAYLISTVTTLLNQVSWRTEETNTGGEFLMVGGGTFQATAGQLVEVQLLASHTNGTGLNYQAGAKLWCHWVGTAIEIGSA